MVGVPYQIKRGVYRQIDAHTHHRETRHQDSSTRQDNATPTRTCDISIAERLVVVVGDIGNNHIMTPRGISSTRIRATTRSRATRVVSELCVQT